MNIVIVQPVVALVAGILILIVPRLLNYIVAIYLIVIGILGRVSVSQECLRTGDAHGEIDLRCASGDRPRLRPHRVVQE